MSTKKMLLAIAVLLVTCAIPVAAQQKLGDLVAEAGYEWIIGKWAATTDQGRRIECEYKWALDKHVVLVDVKMSEFKLHGMIMFVPSREEVVQVSADNRGGTWKGTWRNDYGQAVHRMEGTQANGPTMKGEVVYSKVDPNTMKTAMYGIDDDGNRNAEPWGILNYTRQSEGDSAK